MKYDQLRVPAYLFKGEIAEVLGNVSKKEICLAWKDARKDCRADREARKKFGTKPITVF